MRHCCVSRPKLWASRKQVLAPTAGTPSQLQLHSLGVACLVAVGRPLRQKPVMLQLPDFLLWGLGCRPSQRAFLALVMGE